MATTYTGKDTNKVVCPPGEWTTVVTADVPPGSPFDAMVLLEVHGKLADGKEAGEFRVRMLRDNGPSSTAPQSFTPVSWPGGSWTHWVTHTWFGSRRMEKVRWQVYPRLYISECYVTTRYGKCKDNT